jgi:protein arginine N-methyltransferase 1
MDVDSTIKYHGLMVSDAERTGAYRRAIRATVSPEDVVLDIGTGSGIMAIFSCQAGAARVYAVDSSDIIAVARRLAAANGFADRIHCIQQDVRPVELPERVDVIISELITSAVLGDRIEEMAALARERFLRPQTGRTVPQTVGLGLPP